MKIGFIGTGNMGSSIIKGVSISKFVESENINIFDLDKEKRKVGLKTICINQEGVIVIDGEAKVKL